MRFIILGLVATLGVAGCQSKIPSAAVVPSTSAAIPNSSPSPDTKVFTRVQLDRRDNRVVVTHPSGVAYNTKKGSTAIVVRFSGFPTRGENGLIEKTDALKLVVKANGYETPMTGKGFMGEFEYVMSFDSVNPTPGGGFRKAFSIATEKGVYVDYASAETCTSIWKVPGLEVDGFYIEVDSY